jgi:predicted transcriptional regulator
MIKIFICDFITGTKYNIIIEKNTTLGNLKKIFCTIKNYIKENEEDIYAWTSSPLVINNMTLEQYNLAYDNIVIYFATEWSKEMKTILEYYL